MTENTKCDITDDLTVDNTQNIYTKIHHTHSVIEEEYAMRLDKIAAVNFSQYSRGQIQEWIGSGELMVNGNVQKSKYRIKAGDELLLEATITEHGTDEPEDIALDVIYEDDDVVVINKPVGMVVHPGAGNWTGTLVNGLLFHYPEQSCLPRAGLVHRIDKDTSGLLIIAKNKIAQLNLMEQLKDKSVYRHYQCIVAGKVAELKRIKVIDHPIARHKTQRIKMAVSEGGKESVTHLMEITQLHENYCLLDIALETGRTHQIRVHLSHMAHPLVGDKMYGQRKQLRTGLSVKQREAILQFPRQALHAYKLGFIHPATGKEIQVTAPLPSDMLALMDVLKEKEEYDEMYT